VCDRSRTPELLMQCDQIRLSEIVLDCRVTYLTYKPSHILPDQQSVVVTLCKLSHQEYHWERHSWCPTDEVSNGMLLLMTQETRTGVNFATGEKVST